MKVIIDTNVFISGIFFSGPPYQILTAWQKRKLEFVLSPEILEEYRRVAEIVRKKHPDINLNAIFELLTIESFIRKNFELSLPIFGNFNTLCREYVNNPG